MLIERQTARATGFPDPAEGEPFLLTPGPLTTALEVKQAMLRDWGSWDGDFRAMTADLRRRLVAISGGGEDWDCVPMQGSGTFAVEAMLGSFIPREGKALVLANGAYGLRIAQTLQYMGRAHTLIDKGDYLPPRGSEVAAALDADPGITHVVLVHCETSSGILNPVEEIAAVDGGTGPQVPAQFDERLRRAAARPLAAAGRGGRLVGQQVHRGRAGLRLRAGAQADAGGGRGPLPFAQPRSARRSGRTWRRPASGATRRRPMRSRPSSRRSTCTRPRAAQPGRLARYTANRDAIVAGMRKLGFETLLEDRWLSPIIVTFFNPAHPGFEFGRFYDLLKARGFIIYPGKLTVVDSFRIGCIGRMDAGVMRRVVAAAGEALAEMGVDDAAPPAEALAEREKLRRAAA